MWIRDFIYSVLLGECRWHVLFGRQGSNHWNQVESLFYLLIRRGLNDLVTAKCPKDRSTGKVPWQGRESSWEQAYPFPLIWKKIRVFVIYLRAHNSKNISGVEWGSLLWCCTKSLWDICSVWLSLCHLLLRLQSLHSSEMKFSLKRLRHKAGWVEHFILRWTVLPGNAL